MPAAADWAPAATWATHIPSWIRLLCDIETIMTITRNLLRSLPSISAQAASPRGRSLLVGSWLRFWPFPGHGRASPGEACAGAVPECPVGSCWGPPAPAAAARHTAPARGPSPGLRISSGSAGASQESQEEGAHFHSPGDQKGSLHMPRWPGIFRCRGRQGPRAAGPPAHEPYSRWAGSMGP